MFENGEKSHHNGGHLFLVFLHIPLLGKWKPFLMHSHVEVGVQEWTTAPRTPGTDPALAAAYALTFDFLSENVLI